MAPLRTVCFAVGTAALASAELRPGSKIFKIQGGGSGLETDGDYIENKVARKVYGVFGAAAEEAKHAPKHIKDATKSASESVRESGFRIKDAAKDAAKTARENMHMPKTRWPHADSDMDPYKKGGLVNVGWMGGPDEEEIEIRPVHKFFGNPNNAFVAQGVMALLFGALHIIQYDAFGSKVAEPIWRIIGRTVGIETYSPAVKVVGAYMLGVVASDTLAYKSNSAAYKRGKVWHEMVTNVALALICLQDVIFTESTPAMAAYSVLASIFAIWFGFLSRDY